MRTYKGEKNGQKIYVQTPDDPVSAREFESLKRSLYRICAECSIIHTGDNKPGKPGTNASHAVCTDLQ